MENVIWEIGVDDKAYWVKVVGLDDGSGHLTVKVVATDELLLDERVGLAYGAVFGSNVYDVATWQDKALEAIDSHIAKSV